MADIGILRQKAYFAGMRDRKSGAGIKIKMELLKSIVRHMSHFLGMF